MQIAGEELDIIREIGSIGSGQAATSLSVMMNKKINVLLEKSEYVSIQDFTEIVGGPDKVIAIVYCELSGELAGVMHLILTRENALKLADSLSGKPIGTTKTIGSNDETMFKEVTNIIFGSYISSLSNMLGLKVLFSVPYWAYDIAEAALDSTLIKLSTKVDKVLTMKTRLCLSNEVIEGNIITLFDDETLQRIVAIIRERYLKQ